MLHVFEGNMHTHAHTRAKLWQTLLAIGRFFLRAILNSPAQVTTKFYQCRQGVRVPFSSLKGHVTGFSSGVVTESGR